jgi:hypothetical protein
VGADRSHSGASKESASCLETDCGGELPPPTALVRGMPPNEPADIQCALKAARHSPRLPEKSFGLVSRKVRHYVVRRPHARPSGLVPTLYECQRPRAHRHEGAERIDAPPSAPRRLYDDDASSSDRQSCAPSGGAIGYRRIVWPTVNAIRIRSLWCDRCDT